MNPDTASLSECCDALAEFKGFRQMEYGDTIYAEHGCRNPHRLVWLNDCNGICDDHPIRDLDSIAGALPEGWKWLEIGDNRSPGGSPRFPWSCRVVRHDMYNDKAPFTWGDTELLARARAAVKAWMVVKGNA